MKFKDLYIEQAQRRYSAVTNVKKENITLQMKPIKKIKEKIAVLIIVLVLIIGLLALNFHPTYFFVSIALIASLFVFFIYGNKSSLHCDKDCLNIKQGIQNVSIPYKNLKNVYIGRVSGMLFFLPAFNYNIVVRYQDNFSFLREFEFSLLCADINEVSEFINNFEIEEQIQEEYVVYEKRKSVKKVLGFFATLILAVLIAIYILPKCGIKLF